MVQLAIVRRALALSAPILLLASACGSGDDAVSDAIGEAIESESGEDVDVEFEEDGSMTITDKDGEVIVDIDEDGGTIKVEGEGEDGDETMTIESDEDGSVTVESDDGTTRMADEIPAGFPDDVFPVPSDATELYGIAAETDGDKSFNLSFRVDEDPEQFWNDLRALVPASATIANESSGTTGGNFAAQMVFSGWDGWSGVVTINSVDGSAGVNYLVQPAS